MVEIKVSTKEKDMCTPTFTVVRNDAMGAKVRFGSVNSLLLGRLLGCQDSACLLMFKFPPLLTRDSFYSRSNSTPGYYRCTMSQISTLDIYPKLLSGRISGAVKKVSPYGARSFSNTSLTSAAPSTTPTLRAIPHSSFQSCTHRSWQKRF